MSDQPGYSIIVPVYNGAETLARCLMPLVGQAYPRDRYEVIVVDDGSTDGSGEIAQQAGARVIALGSNRGRIVARNRGAGAAVFETLVFVDSRVLFPADGLRRIGEQAHLPQLFHVFTQGEGRGWFDRLFTLIRARYYRPPLPLDEVEAARQAPFLITPDNFTRAAKGTTALACPRDLWLACQPADQSRHAHDDTPILRAMADRVGLLRRFDLSVTYLQRERFRDVMRHLFLRGPRFASYYLRPGGPFYHLWLLAIGLGLTALAGLAMLWAAAGPALALGIAAGVSLLCLLSAALYLARRPSDVLLVLILLPLSGGAFGAGVLWGLLRAGRPDQERKP